jgi:GTP pyrophosphokinase
MGMDPTTIIGALLHDAVEDQGGKPTLKLIGAQFGPRVAAIVEGCSDSVTAYGEAKAPWRQRKERYLAHLASLVRDTAQVEDGLGVSILRVSVADKLHNLRSIVADYRACGDQVWQRFTGGQSGTLWYYQALVEVYQQGARSRWLPELERLLGELEATSRP